MTPPSNNSTESTTPLDKNILGTPAPKRYYCYCCFKMKSKIIGRKCGACIREQCKGKMATGLIEKLKVIDYLMA